jgi:hypothetical protein
MSPIYQTFIDMVLIEINGELWAISSENCRKAYGSTTEKEQLKLLLRSLQRLR